MATISGEHGRQTVDLLIKNNGIYPGDEDMPVVQIVEYNNMFDGQVAWGLIYAGDNLQMYHNSPACLNVKTIWEKEPKAARTGRPTMDELEHWVMEGYAEATDGCEVEPDGICPHGKESWLISMGFI